MVCIQAYISNPFQCNLLQFLTMKFWFLSKNQLKTRTIDFQTVKARITGNGIAASDPFERKLHLHHHIFVRPKTCCHCKADDYRPVYLKKWQVSQKFLWGHFAAWLMAAQERSLSLFLSRTEIDKKGLLATTLRVTGRKIARLSRGRIFKIAFRETGKVDAANFSRWPPKLDLSIKIRPNGSWEKLSCASLPLGNYHQR